MMMRKCMNCPGDVDLAPFGCSSPFVSKEEDSKARTLNILGRYVWQVCVFISHEF